jgi:hypothetical protein
LISFDFVGFSGIWCHNAPQRKGTLRSNLLPLKKPFLLAGWLANWLAGWLAGFFIDFL